MFDWLRGKKRALPLSRDQADLLIWRSTGTFGDFRMNVCTKLVATVPRLTDTEYEKVLDRYWQHVSYWNVAYQIIGFEIARFAEAAGRDQKEEFKKAWNRLPGPILGGVW